MMYASAARSSAALLCLALFISAAPLHADEAWPRDFEAALAEARASDRPVVADFYATWCGYCRKLRTEVYPEASVRAALKPFVRVRIDVERQPELADRYGVSGVPVVLVLDSDGQYLGRVDGYVPPQTMARRLNALAASADANRERSEELEGDPHNVRLNFETGVRHFQAGQTAEARRYFLRAWNSPDRSAASAEKRRDSLYNAAVASQQLSEFRDAVRYWSVFMAQYPQQNQDYAFARLYRGMAFLELDRIDAARADLEYARQNVPDRQARMRAASLLAALP